MANASTSTMDPEMARKLFDKGATVVLLDVPTATEIGIDWQSWQAGPNFKGIKMIPPGLHFIYFSATNSSGQTAPRTGFFYDFKEEEILVRKWDKHLEEFFEGSVDEEEQKRIEDNKQELDKFLGAYPYDIYRKWISSTSYLSSSLATKLVPLNQKITAVTEFVSEGSTTQSRKAAAENPSVHEETDEQLGGRDKRLPYMKQCPGTALRFSKIPRQKYPDGATTQEVTKYSMDHSYVLRTVLDSPMYKDSDPTDLLGELQFAFLCFLLGQVFDAFEQWKLLVELFCKCDAALTEYPQLFHGFISVVHYQAREIPEDFFVDIISQNNFLVSTLRTFFYNIENSLVEPSLKKKAHGFKSNLQKRFHWDFSTEDDEDEPVVVQTE